MNDSDKIKVLLTITLEQDDFLKTINPDNKSDAMRTIIDERMKKDRKEKLKDYSLIIMVFVILVLAVCQIILW